MRAAGIPGAAATALLVSACASTPSIEPPGGEVLAMTLSAKGVQTYECRASDATGSRFNWEFVGLRAELFDERGRRVPYVHGGPDWRARSGGGIVGHVRTHSSLASDRETPWLYLLVGDLQDRPGRVAAVQRIRGDGGAAPGSPCTPAELGKTARADYSADYRFFLDR